MPPKRRNSPISLLRLAENDPRPTEMTDEVHRKLAHGRWLVGRFGQFSLNDAAIFATLVVAVATAAVEFDGADGDAIRDRLASVGRRLGCDPALTDLWDRWGAGSCARGMRWGQEKPSRPISRR